MDKVIKILLMADDSSIYEFIKDLLDSMGFYPVGYARNGQQLLSMAAEYHPDLVLMDLEEDNRDYIQSTVSIQTLYNIPVVYLLKDMDKQTLEQSKAANPFGFVIKPVQKTTLYTAIEFALFKHHRELSLKKQELKYHNLYDNNPTMYFILDEMGKILSVNRYGAEQLLHFQKELLSHSFLNLFHVDDKKKVNNDIEFCHRNPLQVIHSECRMLRKDGTLIWIREIMRSMIDENGVQTIFVVCENITEQKIAESQKKDLENQVFQSQKMESIGALAGGIAHDFNNLLTVIAGHAELSLLQLSMNHPAYDEVKVIQSASKTAASLTRKLLAFSRKQIIKPKILDFNKVIVDLEKIMGRLIGDDIHIETKLHEGMLTIKADPGQIEQVLMNLVINARDAIYQKEKKSEPNKITIETTSTRLLLEEPSGRDGNNQPDFVLITVTDTGVGMSEDVKARIFEPFFTTKEVGKGTGLGLSTVFGVVKQNRGHIQVSSKPDHGTEFKLFWPAFEGGEPPERTYENMEPLQGVETVLLVEDNKAVRGFTSKFLRKSGYNTFEAEDGEGALKILAKLKGRVDLVVTDMVMPQMNGFELAQKIKKYYPSIKMIFTTGYTDVGHLNTNIDNSRIDSLPKPYSGYSLVSKVRTVLDREGLEKGKE